MRLRLEDREPTRAFWRGHFEVWALSGLTQREYCKRHGLSLKSFGNWRAQLKREDAVGPKARWGRYPRLRPSSGPSSKRRPGKPLVEKVAPARPPISTENAAAGHRRKFSEEAKRRIVEEACQPNVSVSACCSSLRNNDQPAVPMATGSLGVTPAAEEGGRLPAGEDRRRGGGCGLATRLVARARHRHRSSSSDRRLG